MFGFPSLFQANQLLRLALAPRAVTARIVAETATANASISEIELDATGPALVPWGPVAVTIIVEVTLNSIQGAPW